jgi:hypothetical protein
MKAEIQPGCGIYQIRNLANGKRYIGKSTDLAQRVIRHRYLLNSGNHHNIHLQRSYDKHGGANFIFEVVEYCLEDELPQKEQNWIDSTPIDHRINIELYVLDKHNEKNPFFGKKHSEETRQKMSNAKSGLYQGTDNPNYNNQWSEAQKDQMRGSKNTNSKLTEDVVREIKRLLKEGRKHKDIADMFGVSRTVVTRINSGSRWSQVV